MKFHFRMLICFSFLDLLFQDKVYPTKIEILETYNPGAVVRVLACNFDIERRDLLTPPQPIQ